MSLTTPAPTTTTTKPGAGATRPFLWSCRQVFASVLTPSWNFGWLLLICLFLPAYRGCNDQVLYLSQVATSHGFSWAEIYQAFLLVWPAVFGLQVFLGTLGLACSSNPRHATFLWWAFAGLIVTHTMLLTVAVLQQVFLAGEQAAWNRQESGIVGLWLIPSVGLPLLLLATWRYSRNWFDAAMWIQLSLALTAAVSSTFVVPALLLAKELLVGGTLMIACSVGLVMSSIVQLLDGHRALTRRADESPLQLSLKAMLLLMAVGGLGCAWIGAVVFL